MAPWLQSVVANVEPLDVLLLLTDWVTAPASKDAIRMAHKGYVAHHIPGRRIRIRVPHKKRDTAFFQDVAARLNGIDGVQASVAPETGSILIHYQGALEQLLISAAEAGLEKFIDLEMGDEPLAPLADRMIEQAGKVEQKLLASTGGQLDGRSFVMLSLMLAAGVQLFRGQLFGPAVPLLWYAAEMIRNYSRSHLPHQN